ncbi:MAG: hypothetical protein JXQ73_31650 [Phycisphaerae bacterium]|nr:hypothetical protein [Phycisphaerae bacterium]
MSTAGRLSRMPAWLGLCICFGLVGCQREEPAGGQGAAVPKIPDKAGEEKPAAPALPTVPRSVAPASRPGAVEIPSVRLSEPAAAPGEGAEGSVAPPPGGVVEQDAPDAPPFLRRAELASNWVKHKAVETGVPGKWDGIIPAKIAPLIAPYQIKQVATCEYARSKAPELVAELLSIEAHRCEDACGIFSVLATGELSKEQGQLARTDKRGKSWVRHIWRGRHYLRVTVPNGGGGVGAGEACEPLIQQVTLLIPDSAPPELTEALPRPGLDSEGVWLIRDWISLTGPGASELKPLPSRQTSALLGLDKDSLMAIATYRVKGATRPNRVWVVQYDSPDQAKEAYKRYSTFLRGPAGPEADSTMLLAPRGKYLVGTWTAEEESLAPVLPKLQSNLD